MKPSPAGWPRISSAYWSDRTYRAEDPEGHQWWFMQRVREPLAK